MFTQQSLFTGRKREYLEEEYLYGVVNSVHHTLTKNLILHYLNVSPLKIYFVSQQRTGGINLLKGRPADA